MVSLADVLRRHGPAYLAAHGAGILPSHRAAIRAVLSCRTPERGGQLYSCGPCRELRRVFHSCHHRACPRCGEPETVQWRDAQRLRLLPVRYFLLTFTIPEELRAWFRSHQKPAYNLLFREAAATLRDLGANPKWLGAELGFLGVLHTWTRKLVYHPHIHFLVPGGGLSPDHQRWVEPPDPDFFMPGPVLAARFRTRLLQALRAEPDLEASVITALRKKRWVVNVQPAGRGEKALDYLAAYVHRTALGSQRILADDERGILFKYQDGETRLWQTQRLAPNEFLRRWLQHVLPRGFIRVRHYGWLSPAAKGRWNQVLRILLWEPPEPVPEIPAPAPLCSRCGKSMILIGTFPRAP